MKRLRLAVIGAGHLGRIHTRLASTIDRFELIAVVDPSEAARERVAAEFNVRPVADHRELLGQIDAAVIAVPTVNHHEVGIDLIQHGVHLLIEKPLAATVAESEQLVDAAQRAGITLQVGHVERFSPALNAVRTEVSQPKYIDAVRTSGYTFRSTDIGAVLDIMIHDLDIVMDLVQSEVVDVQALGISVFGGHEDMAQARLQFAHGCVANLTASRCSFQVQRQMHIFGESGYAGINFANRQTTLVRPDKSLVDRNIDFEALSPEQKEHIRDHLFEELLPRQDVEAEEQNAILQEQLDFVTSIHEKRTPRVDGHQGLKVMQVAEQVLDAIAAHRWSNETNGPVGPMYTPLPHILPGPASADPRRAA